MYCSEYQILIPIDHEYLVDDWNNIGRDSFEFQKRFNAR